MSIFTSLYSKLAAVLAGLFGLVGLTIVWVTLFSTEIYQNEVTQGLNSRLAEHIVGQKLLMEDKQINEQALEEIFHMLMVINPTIEIYLLDPGGHIMSYSALPGKVRLKRVGLGPVKKWLSGDRDYPILGDDPRTPGGQKVFSAARIPKQGPLEGYLYVILGGEIYDSIVQQLQRSTIVRLSAWIVAASLVFALAAGLVLFAALTGRLKRLTVAMEAFRKGETMERLDLPDGNPRHRADEIDRLILTFKEMAERIDDQMARLQRSDANRRELVANVSHDLRTPLATLQGYMETLLLKADSLSSRDRRHYLETAIRHCERLGKLVGELFELAKLDAEDLHLQFEPFNLGDLVQDVVQEFQLKARENRIHLAIDIREHLPYVHGDIARIERVLENLMENALQHTPPGGVIRLGLAPQDGDVVVEISDTGSGIPEDMLHRIFDRFFQLDNSRAGESGHAGLGLAITQKIIARHGRTIHVASTLNSGTTFSFGLPVHTLA